LLQALNLPIHMALPPTAELLAILQRDKKIRAGTLQFILLKKLGEAFKTAMVTSADIETVITRQKDFA
jgi:3-dehydroquinate synthetase